MKILHPLVLTALGIALFSSSLTTTKADPLDVWHARNSGVTNAFNADAFGNGIFVVVGNQGTVVTSADGVAWTSRNSGTVHDLNSMVFANGLFVVVGQSGTILTSTNGTLWTARSSGTTDFLYDVNYGNGRFVAISDTGTEATSGDGITWTSQGSGTQGLYGLIYGNGKFVAVGGVLNCFFFCYYNSVSYASSDGLNWAGSSPGPAFILSDIAFGSGMFVAVGDGGTIVTSTDGTSWATPPSGTSELLLNVAYGHGTFVVVGAQQGGIFTSTDAAHWTARNSGTTNGLFNIAYGNGTFLAVGNSGTILQSDPLSPPAILAISQSGNQLQFSWPLAAGAFSLQETGGLIAPAWSWPSNQVSTIMGDRTVVTVPLPPENRFYRLAGTP